MFGAFFRFLTLASTVSLSFGADINREIVLAPHAGAEALDAEVRACQVRASAPVAQAEDFVRLGWAFVAKARRTLDAGFYALAEKAADVVDAQYGPCANSRLLRGHVLHNVHRFREAEAVARQLAAERGQPEDFALLSDALLEQGNLAEGVEALQRLVNARPGVEAYSRIAQVRWLKGDLAGAIAAMEMAMRATSPRDLEARAWTLVRLSGFYLQAGRIEAALNAAEASATSVADFPPALLARGRALLAREETDAARIALTRATELNPLPEYQWWLADTLRAAGQAGAAVKIEAQLRARGESADPRTFALFLASRGEQVATAVRLAGMELETRTDVFSHDARAWALFASGDVTTAESEMRAALATGTLDARLLWHAGEIAWLRGAPAEAEDFFRRARPFAATLTPSERARLDARLGASLATSR